MCQAAPGLCLTVLLLLPPSLPPSVPLAGLCASLLASASSHSTMDAAKFEQALLLSQNAELVKSQRDKAEDYIEQCLQNPNTCEAIIQLLNATPVRFFGGALLFCIRASSLKLPFCFFLSALGCSLPKPPNPVVRLTQALCGSSRDFPARAVAAVAAVACSASRKNCALSPPFCFARTWSAISRQTWARSQASKRGCSRFVSTRRVPAKEGKLIFEAHSQMVEPWSERDCHANL